MNETMNIKKAKWYAIQVYSGQEHKAKEMLEKRIEKYGLQNKIFEVLLPMEPVLESKGGRKQVVYKKVYPGYLLVRMIMDDETWYVVRNTPGVMRFVGMSARPPALSDQEVKRVLSKIQTEKPKPKVQFEEGDRVRITSGPLQDFYGTVIESNPEHQKLKVLVTIFERDTPVEVSYDQVEKA